MVRKARLSGLLATYRELTAREREMADRAVEDDPRAREELRLYEREDALLRSLATPRLDSAVTERIMAATVYRRESAFARVRRPVFAVALTLLFMTLVGGTGLASSASLPGDALYPVKRALEQTRMALTLREQAREHYAAHLVQVRSYEVDALLDLGREGVAVEFVGPLEQSASGEWSVAGIPVDVPEGAEPIAPGQAVRVVGQTGDAQVRILTMAPAHGPDGPADGSPTPAGEPQGVPSGPAHTPGVPQAKEPTDAGADREPAEHPEDTPATGKTPPASEERKPTGESEGGAPTEPTPVPPGQRKKTPSPVDETADRGEPSGGAVPEEPTVAPTPTSPGGSNKDPDGRPNPTRRPTQTNTTYQDEPDGSETPAVTGPSKETPPVDSEISEIEPTDSPPGWLKRPTKKPTKDK